MKEFMRRALFASMFCFVLSMSYGTTGCAAIAKILPIVTDIIAEILDAQRKVDQVDAAAKAWFAKFPNEKMEGDWSTAVERTRASLDIAIKAAHGAEELGEADPVAAFAMFNDAWAKMIELALNIGIVSPGNEYGAGPNQGIVVEPPLCLSRGSAK